MSSLFFLLKNVKELLWKDKMRRAGSGVAWRNYYDDDDINDDGDGIHDDGDNDADNDDDDNDADNDDIDNDDEPVCPGWEGECNTGGGGETSPMASSN